jgi:glucose-6-phosphate 1-dehydrogenase
VQIDVPETLTIEGRAGFYEGTGAFRDMIVTHLFQVMGFVAMEPPTSLTGTQRVGPARCGRDGRPSGAYGGMC